METNTVQLLGTPDQVAAFLATTTDRLAKQRWAGTGPRFIKDGRRVLYRWADVESWLEANTYAKASEQ